MAFASITPRNDAHMGHNLSCSFSDVLEAFSCLPAVAFGIGGRLAAAVCEATPLGRSAPVSLDLSGAGRLSLNQIDEFAHE